MNRKLQKLAYKVPPVLGPMSGILTREDYLYSLTHILRPEDFPPPPLPPKGPEITYEKDYFWDSVVESLLVVFIISGCIISGSLLFNYLF